MAKPQKDLIQQALKKLLTSPKVSQQIVSDRKALGSTKVPRTLTKAVEKGDIEALCKYLRQNPTSGIPQPICELMERLRFLSQAIEDDTFHNVHNPDPTEEWLEDKNHERQRLPLGTRDAARQGLVDLAQAWVEGYLPSHTVQPIEQSPQVQVPPRRGRPVEWLVFPRFRGHIRKGSQ